MKIDLSYLFASITDSDNDLEVINILKQKITECDYENKEGIKIFKLPQPVNNLPKEYKKKEETTWQKFAKTKRIKKNKKVFDKNTKKYVSVKKINEEN